jgi:membrane fusion protein, heavy metal efflux system
MKLTWSNLSAQAGWLWGIGLLVAVIAGGITYPRWSPPLQSWVQGTIASQKPARTADAHDHGADSSHDHGDHAHAHDDATSLELSRQAMGNIGLTKEYLKPVELETFQRTITVPAIIVERPGRTQLQVSTPMAGVVTHVHAVRGEAIAPGSLLFELRITAEELVSTQTALLRTLGELDVERREIIRLEEVTKSGAIPQKTLLERQYARDKLEVLLTTQKEALRLHGLSDRQVEDITNNRRLLRDLRIIAPSPDDHEHEHDELQLTGNGVTPVAFTRTENDEQTSPEQAQDVPADESHEPLILRDVLVHKGEIVTAGTTLAVVDDLSELYIEGRAFEQDANLLSTAARNGWKVTAVFDQGDQKVDDISGLELLYSSSAVEIESRILKFYVRLPNEVLRKSPSPNGLYYIEWKYRTGQRLQLRVPVEEWPGQIVLPVDAIAQEGAESFVFQQNGDHFDRIAVRVLYRDQSQAVISNDGSIFPGDVIARRGAHQMLMALRNKAGGGFDPHAGHNH